MKPPPEQSPFDQGKSICQRPTQETASQPQNTQGAPDSCFPFFDLFGTSLSFVCFLTDRTTQREKRGRARRVGENR